jgi:hypothetical protein
MLISKRDLRLDSKVEPQICKKDWIDVYGSGLTIVTRQIVNSWVETSWVGTRILAC